MKNAWMKRAAAALAVTAVFVTGSVADDVLDTIDDAVSAYKSGNYSQAVEDLNYAAELIRQKKGENLKNYLPAPLNGWKASEAETQTASTAMMGGGTVVKRSYTKGDSRIEVQIITDSPMMQTVAMMIGNPMFMGGGGKMIRINRQKAIIEYDKQSRSGQIQMVAGEKYLIIVSGDNVTEDDLKAYAKAIDVKKLNSIK